MQDQRTIRYELARGRLVSAMPSLSEASIGHELAADALEMGFERAVVAYKMALRAAGGRQE